MLVKLDHFPKDRGEHKKSLKLQPRMYFGSGIGGSLSLSLSGVRRSDSSSARTSLRPEPLFFGSVWLASFECVNSS